MAQIIKHRRGPLSNVGSLSVNPGEIVLGTGSLGSLNGPVLFVGDPASNSYKAVPQLYYGSSVPSVSAFPYLEGVSFYDTTGKNLYILASGSNQRLDLAGAISGSAITPLSVTTGEITGSNLYLSGNATIDGNITLGGNITVGDSNTDYVTFGADISSSIIPDSANNFDLGASGSEWRTIYAQQGIFTSASGSFSGSFVGDGSGLTGLATNLVVYGDGGLSGSINLLNQNLKVLGTANEIETTLALNSGSDGYTVQIGLPNDVTIGNNLAVTTNLAVTGSTYTSVIVGSGSIKLKPDANDARYLEVYNTSPTDTHITASSGWLYLGDDTTYVKVDTSGGANEIIEITAPDGIYMNGNLYHSGSLAQFSGSVTIGGNLTVNGTSTIVNSTVVEIGDNIIQLNGTGSAFGGLKVLDPTAPATTPGSFLWDGTNDYWVAGREGIEHRVATYVSASLTNHALLFGNASSQIVSMTAPTTDGDYAKWNGSAWTMTNVVDGGTF
jgi:hypothetical protein